MDEVHVMKIEGPHGGKIDLNKKDYGSSRGKRLLPQLPSLRFSLLGLFLVFIVNGMLVTGQAISHPGADHEIDEITEALAVEPERVDLWIARGRLYRLNGRFEESLKDFDHAKQLAPTDKQVALGRAFTLAALGQDVEAEMELDRVLESPQPSDLSMVSAFAERGAIRARTGRPELAIQDFTAAAQIHPSPELYLARGRVYENGQDFASAEANYREGLLRVGKNVLLKKALIRVLTLQNHYSAALQLVDEELQQATIKSPWYLKRAELLTLMGQENEAVQAREMALAETNQALGRRPTAIHRIHRAKVYIAMGRIDEAKRDLELAVQIAPHLKEARELLTSLEGRS